MGQPVAADLHVLASHSDGTSLVVQVDRIFMAFQEDFLAVSPEDLAARPITKSSTNF